MNFAAAAGRTDDLVAEEFEFPLRYSDIDIAGHVPPFVLQDLFLTTLASTKASARLHEGGIVYPQRAQSILIPLQRPRIDTKRTGEYAIAVVVRVVGAHSGRVVFDSTFLLKNRLERSSEPLGALHAIGVGVDHTTFKRRDIPSWVPRLMGEEGERQAKVQIEVPALGPNGVPTQVATEVPAHVSNLVVVSEFAAQRWHTDGLGHVTQSMYGRFLWEALWAGVTVLDDRTDGGGQSGSAQNAGAAQPWCLDIEFRRQVMPGDRVKVLATMLPAQGATAAEGQRAMVLVEGKVCAVARTRRCSGGGGQWPPEQRSSCL